MAAVGMMSHFPRDSFQGYPQQYAHYSSRAHPEQAVTTTPLAVNPYSTYAPAPQPQQQQPQPSQQTYASSTRSARSSHSPTSDDGQKPSLPSISNLFGMVDGEKRSTQKHAQGGQPGQAQPMAAQSSEPSNAQPQQYPAAQQQRQPLQQQYAQPRPQFQQPPQPHPQHVMNAPRAESGPHMVSHFAHDANSSQRAMIPPTPPMRTDSIGETTQSPSTISTGSSLSGQPHFVASALNNVEADQQRAVVSHVTKRPSIPQSSPYGTSPYATSAYSASPGAISNPGSFYSPNQAGYPVGGAMYSQRPLPAGFPPQPHTAPLMPTANPWEHHHYIGPSSHSTYPQTQERYICPTCNKAFSRPSSLKIHSHSHTGEKPFKCPHAGCGKAFSVRSNMKRHERGCHTGGGGGMVGSMGHMSQ